LRRGDRQLQLGRTRAFAITFARPISQLIPLIERNRTMKILTLATAAACTLIAVGQAAAQVAGSAPCGVSGGYSTECGGCAGHHGYPLPGAALYYGAHDHFSPRPVYAYSHAGIDATRMNQWNQNQAAIYPWHGNYSYWRWGVPTALVVPPTAVFQSAAPGTFPAKPYWPNSTNQFGVYPVRAPH
jgi:hypothetical protein